MPIREAGVVVNAAKASSLLSPFVIAIRKFFKKFLPSFKSADVIQNSISFFASSPGL